MLSLHQKHLNCLLQLASIETAKRNNQLFAVLKQGHKALTELQQEVTVEDAERLMDDSAEAKAYQVTLLLSDFVTCCMRQLTRLPHPYQTLLHAACDSYQVITVLPDPFTCCTCQLTWASHCCLTLLGAACFGRLQVFTLSSSVVGYM